MRMLQQIGGSPSHHLRSEDARALAQTLGKEMKAREMALACLVCGAPAGAAITETLHSATTDAIITVLVSAANFDGRPGLSVDELERALGRWDRTEAKGVLMNKPTLIYELSGGRELQFVANRNDVLYGAIKNIDENWDLIWK